MSDRSREAMPPGTVFVLPLAHEGDPGTSGSWRVIDSVAWRTLLSTVEKFHAMRADRQAMTRARWLTRRVCLAALACVGASVMACAPKGGTRARVPRGSVTGRAATAVGDSGIFVSPVHPYDVRPVIPHADAESAAVAMGYREAPSVQDLSVPYYHNIPTERRRFCGRSYYVRPVLAMPDTTVVRSTTLNDWMMWAPTWVMSICDDQGLSRSSVYLTDVPPGLRVRQGPGPRDVPELVPDSGTFPHIGHSPSEKRAHWDEDIGLTPESAVKAVAALLEKTGAHVADVPAAFMTVSLLDPQPPVIRTPRIWGDLPMCPHWRLTLDRPVTLRGTVSARVARTRTVYVARGKRCRGAPLMQIPAPAQPTAVPFMYVVSHLARSGSPSVKPPDPELRWTTLRPVEPLWFEDARLER